MRQSYSRGAGSCRGIFTGGVLISGLEGAEGVGHHEQEVSGACGGWGEGRGEQRREGLLRGAVLAHATDAVLEASRSGTWKASRASPLPSTSTLTRRSRHPSPQSPGLALDHL